MIKYIIKRLLQLIPILVGITFLSFAMMRLAGGDAVTYMYENAGSAVSQEVIDETRKEYGLDQPFLVQYAKWFAGMATGDMGKSYVSRRDVYETFIEKLPATIMLTISSVLLTMLIAIPLGILSAVQHNKWSDYLIRFLSFIGNSMPNFFVALVLMYFLSIKLGWFPVITTENKLQSLVLPTLTLAISMASKYTRQVRATILEELNKDYVAGAKARGVRGSVIIWAAGTTQEFPYYGGQQMRLARTGGHLYHHTSVKLPLLEKAELHLLLVVAKSVVHAIHYADAGRYRQQKKGKATCIIACSL